MNSNLDSGINPPDISHFFKQSIQPRLHPSHLWLLLPIMQLRSDNVMFLLLLSMLFMGGFALHGPSWAFGNKKGLKEVICLHTSFSEIGTLLHNLVSIMVIL